MAELLVELFSEEIPARMQARAADDLKRLLTDKLKAAGLAFERAEAFVTPRRLALVVDGLPRKQPDQKEERKGPKVGAPKQAVEGFLRGAGLQSIDDQAVEVRSTNKGEFYFSVRYVAGLSLDRCLPSVLDEAISEMPWPKSMRWGNNDFRWVRPLHSILAIIDGSPLVLDFQLLRTPEEVSTPTETGTIWASNLTRGHRFLAPEPIAVTGFEDYRSKLRDAFVVLDRDERKRLIAEGAGKLAEAEGLVLKDDPGLLDEVCGLVEWPVPLIGRIDPEFMAVPPEVLVTSMRSHQKYFALQTKDGVLADRFIVVANMARDPARDATIVAGNEKVLRARLSDAKFFWDQDKAATLDSRVPALAEVTFYDKLGTMADKAARVAALARHLAPIVGADADQAERAARLAKADLTTGMVGEFPELQGVMGRYYALADGEDAEVANAVAEHYSPLGPTDTCPTAPVSVAVALADKLDTLVGFFAIGETPTGSKDPFALRRAALGVIRLIIENDLRLPLLDVFKRARNVFVEIEDDTAEVDDTLLPFFADRLKVHLREEGVRHDLIAAVFELGGEDDLVRLLARVHALAAFLGTDDGANMLVGYRRASNILRAEEKKDGVSFDAEPEAAKLTEPAEKALFEALGGAQGRMTAALAVEDFAGAMSALATLRAPIDRFFDDVTVNADDAGLRINRLRLLARVRAAMGTVADFSKIEG
ncbi:MAG: glycine--tRNA ligase subunit beta [Alphaproteobacteria bacterium]|nr:glycine--tRNA ligase subunit beta [Alphaproteobacteria bacterium]